MLWVWLLPNISVEVLQTSVLTSTSLSIVATLYSTSVLYMTYICGEWQDMNVENFTIIDRRCFTTNHLIWQYLMIKERQPKSMFESYLILSIEATIVNIWWLWSSIEFCSRMKSVVFVMPYQPFRKQLLLIYYNWMNVQSIN